jgi:hypothetical protein
VRRQHYCIKLTEHDNTHKCCLHPLLAAPDDDTRYEHHYYKVRHVHKCIIHIQADNTYYQRQTCTDRRHQMLVHVMNITHTTAKSVAYIRIKHTKTEDIHKLRQTCTNSGTSRCTTTIHNTHTITNGVECTTASY